MRKLAGIFLCSLFLLMIAMPASWAGVAIGISVRIGPPPLPVYAQPICPGPGYLWTPGYWAYGVDGYYWVPGTWVIAPSAGLLWTPGYWGWGGGAYLWHAGYWGPHVGFYGGINYGFGYGGVGFVGGRWDRGVFMYNTAVMHVDTRVVHNTFVDRTVIHETTINRVSFNGGEGGIHAHASAQEEAAFHENHVMATSAQMQHEHMASSNRAFLASENHGRPAVAATARPGEFNHGAMAHENAPRPEARPHDVPRPQAHDSHPQPTSFRGNNGAMQHNNAPQHSETPRSAPRPQSQPRSAPSGGGDHHSGGSEQHGGGGDRHEGGDHRH